MLIIYIYKANIPLNILKLPTILASLKLEERYKVKAIYTLLEAKTTTATTTRAAAQITYKKGRESTEEHRNIYYS
ncbi:uncharacterized protein B0H64DRAFT_316713 [Chaetomium fimeti]|uniref:Uncharacterized protein n=1 Tax=Chaetomium fimeti TaxID=1854472 RepID=A0AAE0LV77_9PEZI|nr:hypothetical protein B0H64DRAFT_316713 [Chaetomium fimeti]